MTLFDDRGQGQEAGLAHQEAMEFKVTMRRNRMLGLWAGEKMGLEGDNLEAYAKAVVRSDLELPGDEDVIRKVVEDLRASNIEVRDSEVNTRLIEFMAQAREAIKQEG